jgi:hypothetical protein
MAAGALICIKAIGRAQNDPKRKVELRETRSIPFVHGGRIVLDKTVGDVSIIGWDKQEAELTVLKATKKLYKAKDQSKGVEELSQYDITMTQGNDNHLLVSAKLPSNNLVFQMLRGGAIELSFVLKIPRNNNLEIKHDAGDVNVTGVKGDISIISRVGDVDLKLFGGEKYLVDAKSRIGEVRSAFKDDRQAPANGYSGSGGKLPYKIYLRLVAGEIRVNEIAMN